MYFLDAHSTLVKVVEENHQVIPIINRFGIRLGFGDNKVGEICRRNNINADFFLAIMNTYLNEDYFPERRLQNFEIELVVDYLRRSDKYLIKGQLHNLEKHLNAFRAMSDPNNQQLELIEKLFLKFKTKLINQVEERSLEGETPLSLIADLKNIIIKHISGEFNDNMCYAVVFSIDSLQKDLEKHSRIREKILKPKIEELREQGIDNWQELVADESISIDNNQPLSEREIDVLRLVARGLINKEIADKLNISLNTVLTHRKNITAKLDIKTVSGLIFYCISHGYISSNEVNF